MASAIVSLCFGAIGGSGASAAGNTTPALISSAASGGQTTDTYQAEITSGAAPITLLLTDKQSMARAAWGASYATSTEIVQLYYLGKARAAANIYQNQRIISVCIWYTRNGSTVAGEVCSNATYSGSSWVAGPEVSLGVWDSLNWNDPHTIFNIRTVRIDPNVFP